MWLINFDYELFRIFNNLASINHTLDVLFILFAEAVVFAMGIGLIIHGMVQKSKKTGQKLIIRAAVSAFLASLAVIPLIRLFFFRPRPFVTGLVNQLVAHNPAEASFPSSHTAIMFSFAFTLLLFSRKWGIAYLTFAIISALSRIVVGVHFPMDIMGGFLVAVFVVLGVKYVEEWWRRRRVNLK